MTDLVAEPTYRLTDRRTLDYYEDEIPVPAWNRAQGLREMLEPATRALVGAVPEPIAVFESKLADVRQWLGRLDALRRFGERQALTSRVAGEGLVRISAALIVGPATEGQCAGGRSGFPRQCRFRAKWIVEVGEPEAPIQSRYCQKHASQSADYVARQRGEAFAKAYFQDDEPDNRTTAGRWYLLREADAFARSVLPAEEVDAIEGDFVAEWGPIDA